MREGERGSQGDRERRTDRQTHTAWESRRVREEHTQRHSEAGGGGLKTGKDLKETEPQRDRQKHQSPKKSDREKERRVGENQGQKSSETGRKEGREGSSLFPGLGGRTQEQDRVPGACDPAAEPQRRVRGERW